MSSLRYATGRTRSAPALHKSAPPDTACRVAARVRTRFQAKLKASCHSAEMPIRTRYPADLRVFTSPSRDGAAGARGEIALKSRTYSSPRIPPHDFTLMLFRALAVYIKLALMSVRARGAALVAEIRIAVRAAFAGVMFALWVPPVLGISFFLSPAIFDPKLPSVTSLLGAIGSLIAVVNFGGVFLAAAVVILPLVGFPTLLVLWLLRLRHPLFPALVAVCVVVAPGRLSGDDMAIEIFFAAVTGYIAGLYARRGGTRALAVSRCVAP